MEEDYIDLDESHFGMHSEEGRLEGGNCSWVLLPYLEVVDREEGGRTGPDQEGVVEGEDNNFADLYGIFDLDTPFERKR